MVKLKIKHFNLFKKYCGEYIKKFQLDDWKVYYEFDKMDDAFGRITKNYIAHVATIYLTDEWDETGLVSIELGIKETAKHEIIHLLLGDISAMISSRFVTEDEVVHAEEKLVRKLEGLL